MSHELDTFYRMTCDLAVVIGQVEREAEKLGLANSVAKLSDMRMSVQAMSNKAMTKIEAAHVAELLEKKQSRTGGIVQSSSHMPPHVEGFVDTLRATGLHVMVIDENTDFSKLPIPCAPDPRTDGSVESKHADEPIDCAAPIDQPPAPSE